MQHEIKQLPSQIQLVAINTNKYYGYLGRKSGEKENFLPQNIYDSQCTSKIIANRNRNTCGEVANDLGYENQVDEFEI